DAHPWRDSRTLLRPWRACPPSPAARAIVEFRGFAFALWELAARVSVGKLLADALRNAIDAALLGRSGIHQPPLGLGSRRHGLRQLYRVDLPGDIRAAGILNHHDERHP